MTEKQENALFGKNRRSWFVVPIILGVLICGIVYAGKNKRPQKIVSRGGLPQIIIFDGKQFSPRTLQVMPGEMVVFRNDSDRLFWPASDAHPAHDLYPEFDPKKPIGKAESWTFQFNQTGRWGYHNHLLPTQVGTVIVGGENSKAVGDCINSNEGKCLEIKLLESVERDGAGSVLSKIGEIYSKNPSFTGNCHGFMHKLGASVYKIFKSGKEVVLTPNTAFCGYGFYHGFIESAFIDDPSPLESVRDFCSRVRVTMAPVLADACLHGVGHGAMAFAVGTIDAYGSAEKTIGKATGFCKEVSLGDGTLYPRCISGVFMEFGNMVTDKQYGMSVSADDPFAICVKQIEINKMDCYTQLYGIVMQLARGDFEHATKIVLTIEGEEYRREAMLTLAGADSDLSSKHLDNRINVCRKYEREIRQACLNGLSLAVLLNGSPGLEFEQAGKVCVHSQLSQAESIDCYGFLLEHDKRAFNGSHQTAICGSIKYVNKPSLCTEI